MVNRKKKRILHMVQLGLLTALVFVLQMLGSFIKIGPLPMSFVLVPIVVGAFTLGYKEGAFLGCVFGVITMVMGIAGIDGFSAILWTANPIWFIIICLLKAMLAGLGSGLIYKGLNKLLGEKRILITTVIASVSAPIINTGVFVVGMLLFFFDTMSGLPAMFPANFGQYSDAVSLVFLGLAGLNFVGEFIVNLVLSPAIVRIIHVIKKKFK